LEIARLRSAGYSHRAIREALADIGVHLSTSALRREKCRLRRHPVIVEASQQPAPQPPVAAHASPGPALTDRETRAHERPEMDTRERSKRKRVRAYAPDLKAQVLAECTEPGASIAKVALAHGLNANMVHTWRRQVHVSEGSSSTVDRGLVAVPLKASPSADRPPIHIELRQGATCIAIAWPVEAAGACGDWLCELLR
jgi:transposase